MIKEKKEKETQYENYIWIIPITIIGVLFLIAFIVSLYYYFKKNRIVPISSHGYNIPNIPDRQDYGLPIQGFSSEAEKQEFINDVFKLRDLERENSRLRYEASYKERQEREEMEKREEMEEFMSSNPEFFGQSPSRSFGGMKRRY